MTRRPLDSNHQSIVHGLSAEAVRLGADTIEVEYRDGYEEVSVLKGGDWLRDRAIPELGRASGLAAQGAPQSAEEEGEDCRQRRGVRDPNASR